MSPPPSVSPTTSYTLSCVPLPLVYKVPCFVTHSRLRRPSSSLPDFHKFSTTLAKRLTTRASALPEGSSDTHNLLDLGENVVVAGVQRLGEGVVKANAVVELHV